MKSQFIALFLFSILFTQIKTTYDVQLQRTEFSYNININEQANFQYLPQCNEIVKDFKYEQFYATLLCHQQDVSYNLNFMMGDINQHERHFNMAVDLTSPFSWIKSEEDCLRCENEEGNFKLNVSKNLETYEKQIKKFQKCKSSCQYDNYFQTTFKMPKEKLLKESYILAGQNDVIQGHLISEQGLLFVYDEEKKMSIQDLKYELKKNYRNHLKDVIEFDNLKVIYASYMVGMESYSADGALGFAFPKDPQQGSSFVEQIYLKHHNNDKSIKKQFGLYLGEICKYKPDFILTIGGGSEEYTHSGVLNPVYIPLDQNSRGHFWGVRVESIKFGVWNSYNKNSISTNNSLAILSTKSSYIALPQDILNNFVNELNNEWNMDCSIVDNKYFQVYCKKVTINHVFTSQIELQFKGNDQDIYVDAMDLFKRCEKEINEYQEKNLKDVEFGCILNVRASLDNIIVLGEPFLKQHYTVFDMENNRIGLMKTIRDSSFLSQFRRNVMQVALRWATFLFISLLVFICFFKQIRRFYKNIRNQVRAAQFNNEITEIQKLTSTEQQDIENYDMDTIRSHNNQQEENENLDNVPEINSDGEEDAK